MTRIVGLVDNGKVWIGGDSAGLGGCYSLNFHPENRHAH